MPKNPASPPCSLCGKTGIVYMVEQKPYCPSCMYKRHPPLEYDGPERRRYAPRSTPFTRRSEDQPRSSDPRKSPRR
jgi:hypothetical protein